MLPDLYHFMEKKNSNLKSTNTKALRAGTALNIKVTVRSENHKIDGLFTQYDTNSLFADKSTSENAAIYYGRHLQNLDTGIWSGRRYKNS